MAYFLTSAPENARPVATPKTHTPFSRVQERGLRFYSPGLGRWVSRDPIEEAGGRNLYVVLRNQPINGRDPLGLTNGPGGSGWPTFPISGMPSLGLISVPFWQEDHTQSGHHWLAGFRWTPPTGGDWDKPCDCKPCKKVIWLQAVTWNDLIWVPPFHISRSWHTEMDESNYSDYGYAWDCNKLGSTDAQFTDSPGVDSSGLALAFDFEFYSYAKCIEGRQAGVVYGYVHWFVSWTIGGSITASSSGF